jgi:hypothetical protein
MPLDGNWLLLRNETGIYIQIFSKKDIHTIQSSGEIIGIITANIRKYIE